MDNNSLAHSRYNCTYHIVFIPKYRRKVMFGELRKDVGEILGKVCRMEGVTIIKAATLPDHVHMYVSIPPKLSVSKAVGLIKGKSALMIFDRHPEYREKGNRHFWARGYYCETVGNVNEETIKSIFRSSTKGIGWSIKRKPLLSGLPVKKERFARPPLGGNAKVLPQGGYPIPPAELVVGPFGGEL